MRDSFVLYRTMYDSLMSLPKEYTKEALKVLGEYALDGKEPEEDGIGKALLAQCRRVIDKNNKCYEAGKKGGRPKPSHNPPETLPKGSRNPVVTQNEKGEMRKEKDKHMSVFQTSVEDKSTTAAGGEDKSTAGKAIPYKEIVDYLNLKTGKSFLSKSKDTRQHIRARFAEGFTLEDFKKVIDTMTEKWKGDARMVDYLRPATLFCTKFESYLNASPGRAPAKVNKFTGNGLSRDRTDDDWLDLERNLGGAT